jgi:hypothetical protein
MEELKEGDKVVCVNDRPREGKINHIPLQAGKEYFIQYIRIANGKPHVAIRGLLIAGSTCPAADAGLSVHYHWFNPARFKKI